MSITLWLPWIPCNRDVVRGHGANQCCRLLAVISLHIRSQKSLEISRFELLFSTLAEPLGAAPVWGGGRIRRENICYKHAENAYVHFNIAVMGELSSSFV